MKMSLGGPGVEAIPLKAAPAAGAPLGPRPRVGLLTQVLYSLGTVSTGVKQAALSSFLLIYYNQAVGLPPTLVALAMSIVMIFDAISDPVTGYISDHLRTPWGRRHPLMYGAALPLAVGFVLLWNPPTGWGDTALFFYLFGSLAFIRVCDTLFELPSVALAPELVEGYDARTGIVSIRIFFRTVANMSVTILGLQLFLKPHADGSGGPADRAGYLEFSLVLAAIMFTSILISAGATHRFIPWLRKPPALKRDGRGPSLKDFTGDLFGLLRNGSARAILGMGAFAVIATGARNGLELYFGLYFWQLGQGQIALLASFSAVGALAGATLVPFVSRWLGKRRGMITCYALQLANGCTPITLRLADLMPANGSSALFVILAIQGLLSGMLFVMTAVLMNSMLADVIEDVAVSSGQRSEALLFSADSFFTKATSGLGVLISGALLSIVAFPRDVKVHAPDADTVWRLGALYVPTVVFFTLCSIGLMLMFRIDRAKHEANLAALRATELADAGTSLETPAPIP